MKKTPISVIKQMFIEGKLDEEMIERLKLDERKGVQSLVKKYEKEKKKEKELLESYQAMLMFENAARKNGAEFIAGVDEAGRGPLAGPVVAAAVILPSDFTLLGLNDSKQLSEKDRNYYFDIIIEKANSYSVSIISNEKIDEINILEATKLAMFQSIGNLGVRPDHVLLDAVELNNLSCTSEALVKGDSRSVSIAAASVLAKVTRDRLMKEIHNEFPMYDFAGNMGYGTKKHLESLSIYGATPYHRKTFSPVRKALEQGKEVQLQ